MQGASPLASPGLNPGGTGTTVGIRLFYRKSKGICLSIWAVPAAKERGDRGRWNYPSQATAAFEMVLSPGAGIASAAGVQLSPLPPTGTTAAGIAGAAGNTPLPPRKTIQTI